MTSPWTYCLCGEANRPYNEPGDGGTLRVVR